MARWRLLCWVGMHAFRPWMFGYLARVPGLVEPLPQVGSEWHCHRCGVRATWSLEWFDPYEIAGTRGGWNR